MGICRSVLVKIHILASFLLSSLSIGRSKPDDLAVWTLEGLLASSASEYAARLGNLLPLPFGPKFSDPEDARRGGNMVRR